tara:strand:+ start:707 stop:835 length:129 start_codon:yes stop_codon:yes gene_type:complete
MPKAIKVRGGYVVVHKGTGKILHRYTGKDAKTKALAVVRAGY